MNISSKSDIVEDKCVNTSEKCSAVEKFGNDNNIANNSNSLASSDTVHFKIDKTKVLEKLVLT